MTFDWERMARARMHPMQVSIIGLLSESDEPMTPKDMAAKLGVPLGNLSHHVRLLCDKDLIALDHVEPRRGALAHFYTIAT